MHDPTDVGGNVISAQCMHARVCTCCKLQRMISCSFFGPREQFCVSHLQPAMRSAEKRVSSASMSALTAAMMILFECDMKRIVLESQTSMVAVCSVINCMQTRTCWAEQSSFLAEVCALFTVARKAYCKADAETGSFAVPEMPLVSEFWVAPVKPPAPVVNLLAKWSIEKQAMFFQRFAIATLFVQKLLESMPDGADELSDQLEKLAAHMADCMCFLAHAVGAARRHFWRELVCSL